MTITWYGSTMIDATFVAPVADSALAFAGGSDTSTAVTARTVAMIASSTPTSRRKRRRSATEAIPAFRAGTENLLLNAPSASRGRTSATLTTRSCP